MAHRIDLPFPQPFHAKVQTDSQVRQAQVPGHRAVWPLGLRSGDPFLKSAATGCRNCSFSQKIQACKIQANNIQKYRKTNYWTLPFQKKVQTVGYKEFIWNFNVGILHSQASRAYYESKDCIRSYFHPDLFSPFFTSKCFRLALNLPRHSCI